MDDDFVEGEVVRLTKPVVLDTDHYCQHVGDPVHLDAGDVVVINLVNTTNGVCCIRQLAGDLYGQVSLDHVEKI